MIPIDLNLIQEIDRLWNPVYPYLSQQIQELYGRQDGDILEIGPFCGVIFTLKQKNIGSSFLIATFPAGMGNFFCEEAKNRKIEEGIKVIETGPSLAGVEEDSIDLAIFRGAFFFPSLFKVNFTGIYRVLRKNGIAFIGGGFGKFTPDRVIQDIGKKSRDINLKIGKREVGQGQLLRDIQKSNVKGKVEVISEGGLWVVMRK
jgi:hypothetical protein